jgi:hypothetical protein
LWHDASSSWQATDCVRAPDEERQICSTRASAEARRAEADAGGTTAPVLACWWAGAGRVDAVAELSAGVWAARPATDPAAAGAVTAELQWG